MVRHNIPTAKYKEVNSYDEAIETINDFDYPLVIKADGLAAVSYTHLDVYKRQTYNTISYYIFC